MLTSQSESNAQRLPEIDGLRALAISSVLFHHSFAPIPIQSIKAVAAFGWVGVDLFFVISGFLIGGILLDNRAASNYYRVFYIRRFWRIVPLYLAILMPALVVIVFGLQSRMGGHTLGQIEASTAWVYLFFLQNVASALFLLPQVAYLAPLWSLAVEEQFYLLLPPVVRKLKWQYLPVVACVAIFLSPLLRALLWWRFDSRALEACYVLLPCRWDALLMGVLCAFAVRTDSWKTCLTNHVVHLRIIWSVLAGGTVWMIAIKADRCNYLMQVFGYTWIAAFFAATLLLAVINKGGIISRILCLRVLRPIALVSYGLYLLHPLITALVQKFFFGHANKEDGWQVFGANLVMLVLTGIVAAASWKLYESHLIRIGHRYKFQRPEDVLKNQT